MEKKIELIKTVFPNASRILPFATDENIEKLFEQAKKKVEVELDEAQFE